MEFDSQTEPQSSVFSIMHQHRTDLSIIFLTDYHMKEVWVSELKKWYESSNMPQIDLVLLGGDFDNLSVYSNDPDHPEYKISEARIAAFFASLGFLQAPIYFVPGNHDPASFFQHQKEGSPQHSFADHSFNCHLKMH